MSSPSLPVIDNEAIENLRALGEEGDDSFLREIIGIYLEDVPQRLADLKTALASGDQPLFTRSAHTIKGSSANVGALEVRAVAEKTEHRSKIEPIATVAEMLPELEAAFDRACVALKALVA